MYTKNFSWIFKRAYIEIIKRSKKRQQGEPVDIHRGKKPKISVSIENNSNSLSSSII